MLCVSTPEEARESLLAMVLLVMDTFSESSSDMPAPSQPATLLTMMLLVTDAEFHEVYAGLPRRQVPNTPGVSAPAPETTHPFGNVETSVPLTCCMRMPPPLPLSAVLPWI